MGNPAGVYAVLAAFVRPGLVVPHVVVPDITHVDWKRLRVEGGVEHVVIDKDNCVTLPLRDDVAPGLSSAWRTLSTAGFQSVLVVSNSAGSSDDPLALGAERVARRLGQRVLAHPAKKPAKECAKQVVDELKKIADSNKAAPAPYFGHIAVVGDRITTDMVLASRIDDVLRKRYDGDARAIGILTERVLEPERFFTRIMRNAEMWSLARLTSRGIAPGQFWWRPRGKLAALTTEWQSLAVRDDCQTSPQLTTPSDEAQQEAASLSHSSPAAPSQALSERVRALQSAVLNTVKRASGTAISFVGQGWHLINDGIRIGTNGRIGASDDVSSLPRHRHATLDRLARRPYQPQQPNPFLPPPTSSTASRLQQRRSYSTRTTKKPKANVGGYAKSKTRIIEAVPSNARRPVFFSFPPFLRYGYYAGLVILPTAVLGGYAWAEYDAKQKFKEEMKAAETSQVTLRPSSTPVDHPQVAPSIPTSDHTTPPPVDHKVVSQRQARLQAVRELADIDEKLAVIRARRKSAEQKA